MPAYQTIFDHRRVMNLSRIGTIENATPAAGKSRAEEFARMFIRHGEAGTLCRTFTIEKIERRVARPPR